MISKFSSKRHSIRIYILQSNLKEGQKSQVIHQIIVKWKSQALGLIKPNFTYYIQKNCSHMLELTRKSTLIDQLRKPFEFLMIKKKKKKKIKHGNKPPIISSQVDQIPDSFDFLRRNAINANEAIPNCYINHPKKIKTLCSDSWNRNHQGGRRESQLP